MALIKDHDPNETGSDTAGLDQRDGVAFVDIVLNLFAVLIIFLLIIPFGEAEFDAEAPTENREELPLLDTRACYVESLRMSSQFVLFRAAGSEIVDFDAMALDLAAQDTLRVTAPQGELEVTLSDQIDGNMFRLVLEMAGSDAPGAGPAALDADVAAAVVARLQRDVFDQGYSAVILVPFDEVAAFAPVHRALVQEGARFRWRVMAPGDPIIRSRANSTFRSGDFCR